MQPAYRDLLAARGDRCGTVRLAGRSIGAPFVGAVAAALVIAEFVRLAMGSHRHEVFSCHLRDLGNRTLIRGGAWQPYNPGTVAVDDLPRVPNVSLVGGAPDAEGQSGRAALTRAPVQISVSMQSTTNKEPNCL